MALAERGNRIGLNLKKRLFFFQGNDGINLNEGGQKSQRIPKDISDHGLQVINIAIRRGELVVGQSEELKVKVPANPDKAILEILQRGKNHVEKFVLDIRDDKEMDIKKKVVIWERLIELENKGKNKVGAPRVGVTLVMDKLLSNVAGISHVVEDEKEEIKIQVN